MCAGGVCEYVHVSTCMHVSEEARGGSQVLWAIVPGGCESFMTWVLGTDLLAFVRDVCS